MPTTVRYFLCSAAKSSLCTPSLVWWRADSAGYTLLLEEAGLYSKKQADALVSPTTFAIPEHVARTFASDRGTIRRESLEYFRDRPDSIKVDGFARSDLRSKQERAELDGTWVAEVRS